MPSRSLSIAFFVACFAAFCVHCGESQSKRCAMICKQWAQCEEQRSTEAEAVLYSQDECVDACVVLERERKSKESVDSYAQCAQKAGENCEMLMQCP